MNTARAHVLLSDAGTRDEGERVLVDARETALSYGLRHQLDNIERIQAATVKSG